MCSQHGNNPDELQGRLFELVGDSGFELMLEVMEHSQRISGILSGALTATAPDSAIAHSRKDTAMRHCSHYPAKRILTLRA